MKQPGLFQQNVYGETEPAPPLVRAGRGDPSTSHESAARAEKSGKVKRHRAIALELVKAMPDSTGHELWMGASDAHRLELGNYHELYRRLADLKNAGLIEQGEPRPCRQKGTRMMVWRTTS